MELDRTSCIDTHSGLIASSVMQISAVHASGRESRRKVEKRAGARSTTTLRHRLFHKAVVIERRRLDRDRVIVNTKVALDALLHEWPLPECPQRKRALKACLAVMRGEQAPGVARRALIVAAKAARILREE
ncbi:DUF982 domain-containing protein [Chelativorans sp. J32]|uniref:DUF982 domain-containing protein n=1 Tax=Chelativorans sp. J32 TaxID=935840 RepID=UPI001FDA75C5|nr:DUF982 domain-containing protein [Chelativorans sp. J32]